MCAVYNVCMQWQLISNYCQLGVKVAVVEAFAAARGAKWKPGGWFIQDQHLTTDLCLFFGKRMKVPVSSLLWEPVYIHPKQHRLQAVHSDACWLSWVATMKLFLDRHTLSRSVFSNAVYEMLRASVMKRLRGHALNLANRDRHEELLT